MKKIVREYEFTPSQHTEVIRLARELSLTQTTASILFARGMDTAEKMRAFLHPSREHFLSPFLMQGMKEAVALLTQARDEGWNVAVYGDYDADGIGALAILTRALKEFGINSYPYVPERMDGYGMSVQALDKIFDDFLPDLIVTVDCGISNKEEVEYAKELGAYVIVTDHHELPEELPDCVVINPKLKDEYPYDNLCGAGVAFKLACALIGEKAYDLLDFCALSTVADSVPLLGENRDIVAEGLKLIEKRPRPCFSALLSKSNEITAQTLAFTIAPRVNAAGRMGDANAALQMFLSEDETEVYDLAVKLNAYNLERQKSCDDLYVQAALKVAEEGAYGNIVMLAGEGWNAGFVGIVAARIAEEYARPTILFVKSGDALKGSARSIDTVNIFEALRACSEHIEEFGGHAQAAGINLRAENFPLLKRALDEYLGAHYTREDFVPVVTVCEETASPDRRLARELEALEPFGMGNRRPLFAVKAGAMKAELLKAGSPHVSVAGEELDFMYFGGADQLELLRSDIEKTIIFEYNLSHFRGREYLKGFIRTVLYDGATGDISLEAFENELRGLLLPKRSGEAKTSKELDDFIREKRDECAYGLCCVYTEKDTPSRYSALEGLAIDVFRPSENSVVNALLYAPTANCDLSEFREVVYLDRPASVSVQTGRAKVLICSDICGHRTLRDLSVSREELLEVYAALRAEGHRVSGDSYAAAARSCSSLRFSDQLFVFALAVFEELGLVSLAGGRLEVFRGVRTELTNSRIYQAALAVKEA